MSFLSLRRFAMLSIAAALTTIVMKSMAYWLTGSVGLLADALESGVNLLAAVTAYGAIWYSAQPADPNHAYGHEKIEFFSSGLEGVLIGIAGLATAWEAIKRLIYPEELQQLGIGVGIAMAAAGINFVVGLLLLRAGRKYNSLVLQADGHHLMTDVWTTVAVVVGLGLVVLTGIRELDSIFAMLVGLHIVGTGFWLVRKSFDGLMDHALPVEDQDRLREAIRSALPSGADFHLLRTRLAGRRKLADFHLLVDGGLAVREAHAISHELEAKVRATIPDIELTIHVEPIDERESWESEELAALGEPSEPTPREPEPPPIDD